jgi:predicted phage terminase large subunit-like protein
MALETRKQAHEFYASILRKAEKSNQVKQVMAELGRRDLFFLLVYLCGRRDIDRDWLYSRCREVRLKPNGMLDLWAREHYKSTIITFGLTIQDVINDPEVTIGIFSITRPNSKKFLYQIREELSKNRKLIELYPDILWESPGKEAPKWSLDEGIIVKRDGNPKEATIEAHGLVEGMPTGRHFKIRVYDDVIDEENVTNPDMIKKATKAWELSLNLGSTQPVRHYPGQIDIERYAGTRYHYNDPYAEIMRRKVAEQRIYPGTVDGTPEGEPVLWTREFMEKKRRSMGSYTFGCQILQDPKADEVQGFKQEWLKFYRSIKPEGLNLYLLCDPAGEKKKENDYTVQLVIGLGPDRNYYLIAGIRDRLNLAERTKKLFAFHRTFRPVASGYEKYGKDSDIEHIQEKMELENYRFPITTLGGPMPKLDRIRRLIPLFEAGRFYLPEKLIFIDHTGRQRDLVRELIDEEYDAFPVAVHDDILDCMARIVDDTLCATWPIDEQISEIKLSDDEMAQLPVNVGFIGDLI